MVSNSQESTENGSSLPIKIFAYGTLMQGYIYHFAVEKCRFLGRATTVEKYSMYSLEYPYVNSQIHEEVISGEVYEIEDTDTLALVDEIEGHPTMYYRAPIAVKLLDSDEVINAQIYFNDREPTSGLQVERISDGSFHSSRLAPIRKVQTQPNKPFCGI